MAINPNPNPNLPEEILIEIFSKVPSKSIGKFRCLSKSWRALLSTPNFIKSHLLTRKTHQRQSLILIAPRHSIYTISTIQNYAVARKLDLSNTWDIVIGSCNGLVLLENEKFEVFLVNPTTKEQVKIPPSPLVLRPIHYELHGLGYDSSSDDYKIVTLSYYDIDSVDTFVDVYSVKTGVWKRVQNSPYDHSIPDSITHGAFVSGAIHWLANIREADRPTVIVAFDFVEEVFHEIPLPTGLNKGMYVYTKLVVLEGSLCLMDTGSSDIAEFWTLKEYGKVESWTKLCIDYNCVQSWSKLCITDDYGKEIIKPLCLIGDDELLVMIEHGLVVYNLKDGCFEHMVVDAVPIRFSDAITFKDSLVSPAYGTQIGANDLL